MARTPKTELTREEKRAKADAAEQEALLREVDDAVRQGDFESFMARYGKPLLAVLVVFLAGLAFFLMYWQPTRNAEMEKGSEELVLALDRLEAGRIDDADDRLAAIESGTPALSAKMLRAGIAAEKGDTAAAAALFAEVADDESAPDALRDLALIRRTALTFDSMKPEAVVAAMKPLAVPGEPFFASAGELLAHAYIAQDKRSEAGALFAEIARDENTPDSARSRMLNMAGILGVDAVDDVREVLEAQARGSADGAATVAE